MLKLTEIIRSRVQAQSLHSPVKSTFGAKRLAVLSKSWWVYSDYDIQSRISNQLRFPKRRVPIHGYNRIISLETFYDLLPSFRKKIVEDDTLHFIKENTSFTIQEITSIVKINRKEVEKSVTRGLKTWNLIKYQNKIYHWETFLRDRDQYYPLEQMDNNESLNEELLIKLLRSYPYLTINQIVLLTGFSLISIENTLYKLVSEVNISRGIMRTDSNEEYFHTQNADTIYDVNWDNSPSFTLEKRDALVEIIKLEKHLSYSNANYWFFMKGLPVAQFNLKKDGKTNHFIVYGFNRLNLINIEIDDIEIELKKWAENSNISISIDFTDSPYASLTKQFIKFLEKRGYGYQDGSLSLQLDQKAKTSYNPFSMDKLGKWYLDKQLFNSTLNTDEIVHELIQLNDLSSLLSRQLNRQANKNFENIVYTSGINYKLGFIHKNNLPMIAKSWPRQAKLNNIDYKILRLVEDTSNQTEEIIHAINQPRNKIIARLRYLESFRKIHRDLNSDFRVLNCQWNVFSFDIDPADVRSVSEIKKIITKILTINIPLTINQLSRLLGLTFAELSKLKDELLKKGEIIEGYFFDIHQDLQLSTPGVVNSIQNIINSANENSEKIESSFPEVNLVPQSDPLATLHLPELILTDKILSISDRIDPLTEIWMILWNSSPCGYLLKIPSNRQLIDFDIEIKLLTEFENISILSLIIDKLSYFNQIWSGDQLFLSKINDGQVTSRRYDQLHFILESVNISY
ncbi:MAG: hypothetical protein ACW99Q_24480 [Candidatus Kariarchaeaceae archaeon]|jgi:DNA-binding Lrp family transcriptional regulator